MTEVVRDKVLLMLDTKAMASLIAKRITSELGFSVLVATYPTEAERMLEESADELALCVVAPTFDPSDDNRALQLALRRRQRCVVVTSSFSTDTRDAVVKAGALDYFIKDTRLVDNILRLLARLKRNADCRVLVVDDSGVSRAMLQDLMERLGCPVLTASDGVEALQVLRANPDTKLVLTDLEMPNMGGIELTAAIRAWAPREKVAVVGLSAREDRAFVSAEFLKRGANDFLSKPYSQEELICRVTNTLDLIDYLADLERARADAEHAARTDALTQVHNRRSFMYRGNEELARSRRKGTRLSLLMLDVDHFKKVNDTHGHAAGDAALCAVAKSGSGMLRAYDTFGRLGGEEFAVLLPETSEGDAMTIAERMRRHIAETDIDIGPGGPLRLTVSVGVSSRADADMAVDSVLGRADAALYEAKQGGRNRIVLSAHARS